MIILGGVNLVHLSFCTDVKNYKVVFYPTKKLFDELFKLTQMKDVSNKYISIRRLRDNFIIDIDKDDINSSKAIFELYTTTDPLKWTSIVKYIKLPS